MPVDGEIPDDILEKNPEQPVAEVPHVDDIWDRETFEPHTTSEIASTDEPYESPAIEQVGEGAENPVGTLLQGTLAPPSTPFITKSVPVVPSGLIAASVHSLSTEKLDHLAPVEVDEIHHHDVPEIPPVEQVTVQTVDAQVTEVEVPPVEDEPIEATSEMEGGEIPSEEHQDAERGESIKESIEIVPDVPKPVVEEVDDHLEGKEAESHSVLEEAAGITAIPAVLTAGTIGLVATATQHKPTPLDLTDTEDSTPLIHVVSPDTPSLSVQGPFVEPLKHHVQPEEILPPLSDHEAQNLASPFMPVPREPTRLPNGRPSTSYSWLGHLFQPISPEIIEADQNGWIAVPEVDDKSVHAKPPVRRHSSRLKRRLKRLSRVQEQVQHLLDLPF